MTNRSEPRLIRPPEASAVSDDALLEVNRLWTIARTFSNAAHEINNALQVIAGNAELLELRLSDPDLKRRVAAVRAQSSEVAASVERLLEYARVKGPHRQRMEIRPLIESAVAMRSVSARRRHVSLSIERHDGQICLASVDPARLVQAVVDLLLVGEEAVGGRAQARIDVRLVSVDGSVTIVVTARGVRAADEGDARPLRGSDADALTRGAQLWAAGAIAASLGGTLLMTDTDGELTMSLALPPGERP